MKKSLVSFKKMVGQRKLKKTHQQYLEAKRLYSEEIKLTRERFIIAIKKAKKNCWNQYLKTRNKTNIWKALRLLELNNISHWMDFLNN